MGLVSAAEWLLSGFKERTGVRCHLHAPQDYLELDEERGTAAFRILQESLTNITRYAEATEVKVRIALADGVLEMDIRDNGVGFDPAEVKSRKTFGLMGMRERARQFGGESHIDSRLGAGTTMRIRIPCARRDAK
jgi:signal transduction histidine kinase